MSLKAEIDVVVRRPENEEKRRGKTSYFSKLNDILLQQKLFRSQMGLMDLFATHQCFCYFVQNC